MKYRKFRNHKVKYTLDSYPQVIHDKLLVIRELIFQIAAEYDEIGEIEETLKWDNPGYLTHNPKSGTTVRLSKMPTCDNKLLISVHCQTSLIAEFKELYPQLKYDGNRSIILDVNNILPVGIIEHFIYLALTYHNRKKRGIGIVLYPIQT